MNPIDVPPADPDAPMPELLEDYKSQHEKLLAHTRELQRLRDQVRSTAEREAAAIVTDARRDVRKLLLDARHELLVLVAQLQAVGCESKEADRGGDPQGEPVTASVERDPFSQTRETVTGARRDVREVLLEARTGLLSLADEGRYLRAHVAEQRSLANEPAPFLPEAPPLPKAEPVHSTPPPPASRVARIADRESIFVVEDLRKPAPEQLLATAATHQAAPRSRVSAAPPMYYSAPASSRSIWIACAGALGFAAVGVFLLWWWPGSARDTAVTARVQAATVERSQTGASPTSVRTSAAASPARLSPLSRDPSIVSVVVDARRAAWVRATVDGAGDRGRLLAAGEKSTLTGRRDVVIRAGDAGAVFVSVDGQPAKALGVDGQVITRRYLPRQPRPAAVTAAAPPIGSARPDVAQAVAHAPAAGIPPPSPMPALRAGAGMVGTPEPASTPAKEATQDVPPVAASPIALPPRPAQAPDVEIINANSRWFEAYYAGDRATMQTFASQDFTLADERTGSRLPPNPPGGVQRSMDQIRVEVAGDGAVLSARLTERLTVDGETVQRVSMVSQVWIRQSGRWRLVNVRFVDAANLGLGLGR